MNPLRRCVPAPPKGELLCIFWSAPIKLPPRGQISPGRGKMSPQVTKGGIWHRAAMPERVRFGWSFAPKPLHKEFGKKMSKSVDNCPDVWYYT